MFDGVNTGEKLPQTIDPEVQFISMPEISTLPVELTWKVSLEDSPSEMLYHRLVLLVFKTGLDVTVIEIVWLVEFRESSGFIHVKFPEML